MFEDDDDREYHVVRNDAGQYSIWPASHPLPAGWQEEGRSGRKPECLEYVAQVWTDLGTVAAPERGDR